MASSEEPRLLHVKVGENRDYVDDYRGSGIGGGAGRTIRRRRPSHDFCKLPKLRNVPSMSTEERHALYTDSKGIVVVYIPNYLIQQSPSLLEVLPTSLLLSARVIFWWEKY